MQENKAVVLLSLAKEAEASTKRRRPKKNNIPNLCKTHTCLTSGSCHPFIVKPIKIQQQTDPANKNKNIQAKTKNTIYDKSEICVRAKAKNRKNIAADQDVFQCVRQTLRAKKKGKS